MSQTPRAGWGGQEGKGHLLGAHTHPASQEGAPASTLSTPMPLLECACLLHGVMDLGTLKFPLLCLSPCTASLQVLGLLEAA